MSSIAFYEYKMLIFLSDLLFNRILNILTTVSWTKTKPDILCVMTALQIAARPRTMFRNAFLNHFHASNSFQLSHSGVRKPEPAVKRHVQDAERIRFAQARRKLKGPELRFGFALGKENVVGDHRSPFFIRILLVLLVNTRTRGTVYTLNVSIFGMFSDSEQSPPQKKQQPSC